MVVVRDLTPAVASANRPEQLLLHASPSDRRRRRLQRLPNRGAVGVAPGSPRAVSGVEIERQPPSR
jgi:hypothetical protein